LINAIPFGSRKNRFIQDSSYIAQEYDLNLFEPNDCVNPEALHFLSNELEIRSELLIKQQN
jgi:hypothetical protein